MALANGNWLCWPMATNSNAAVQVRRTAGETFGYGAGAGLQLCQAAWL